MGESHNSSGPIETHCFCSKKREDLYLTSKMAKNKDQAQDLQILFTSQMVVAQQVWDYGFMAYIGETGGFVGLFLGWSLLQMQEVIVFCLSHRYFK